MPLTFIRDDITRLSADAIVNAANESLLGGGGVDGAIHRAAGPGLLRECRTLHGCRTGEAKITGGYRLPAKYVIHTVGPIYQDGKHGEEALLRACYRNSLLLAQEKGLQSIAFPLISAGVYGYPKDQAIAVAVDEIRRFLLSDEDDLQVTLVFYDPEMSILSKELFGDLQERIDDAYYAAHTDAPAERRRLQNIFTGFHRKNVEEARADAEMSDDAPSMAAMPAPSMAKAASSSEELKKRLASLDESFSEMLLRKIVEQGMTDAECYKKANIDRKLFSKIRSNPMYRPKKTTALAFAISLKLSLPETEELLKKAGYALSGASKTDIIIRYFIERGRYDIFDINEALYEFDQALLGA